MSFFFFEHHIISFYSKNTHTVERKHKNTIYTYSSHFPKYIQNFSKHNKRPLPQRFLFFFFFFATKICSLMLFSMLMAEGAS